VCICRVGQNRTNTYINTVSLVVSKPKIPYTTCIYVSGQSYVFDFGQYIGCGCGRGCVQYKCGMLCNTRIGSDVM